MTAPAADTPVSERLITHLRHVDLAVPDYDRELEFLSRTRGPTAETADTAAADHRRGWLTGQPDRGAVNRWPPGPRHSPSGTPHRSAIDSGRYLPEIGSPRPRAGNLWS